jgi:tRNA threonylcarbamoyl adenosine modification protein YeaZ
MNILAVDTTRKQASIFLMGEKFNKWHMLDENEKQSEFLMLNIDRFLKENSLNISDIDAFGVVSGPGSFTGIRVGVATMKAFSYALNKKIVGTTVFDIVKDEVKNGVFIIECTSTTCYYAEICASKIVKVGIIDKENLSSINQPLFILQEEHNLFDVAYTLNVLNNYSSLCCDAIRDLIKKKKFAVPEPYYVQLSQAERNLEKKND